MYLKRQAEADKIFFWDTGIRNALLDAFAADESRPDIGDAWENWVIAELAKRNALLDSPHELFFWRSRTQAEVELVVKGESRAGSAAFRAAYGVDVEPIGSDNPFVADFLRPSEAFLDSLW